MIDVEMVKSALRAKRSFKLNLSKYEARVFVEMTRDMYLDDVLFINNHPGRPFLRGIIFVAYASVFYGWLFGLATFLYKNKADVLCEMTGSGREYILEVSPVGGTAAKP